MASGQKLLVGQLAENSSGCYFQYDNDYLSANAPPDLLKPGRLNSKPSLSPFSLKFDKSLQLAPRNPHRGLHGVFADSLPDGWGLYLMDRVFRENGLNPAKVTMLDRLAYVGNRGAGALSYEPFEQMAHQPLKKSLVQLGKEAVKEFEGTESDMLKELSLAAGSGGARPKLNINIAGDRFSTNELDPGEKWLIKFTSTEFLLRHEESLIEAIYMKMAKNIGFSVADFKLFDAGSGRFWLGQKRFDCTDDDGRLHMHSACGLLDANFREPSLDYVDLIKVAKVMCGPKDAQELLKRAIFNFLVCNQDDHAKNWAFLLDDNNQWSISPFYDIVYSPSPYGEHMTSYMGNGKKINKRALEVMAKHAGLRGLHQVTQWIDLIYQELTNFSLYARELGVSVKLTNEIQQIIDGKYKNFS